MAKLDRVVIGGVGTHQDVHVAALVDEVGRILETSEFSTTPKRDTTIGALHCWRPSSLVGIAASSRCSCEPGRRGLTPGR